MSREDRNHGARVRPRKAMACALCLGLGVFGPAAARAADAPALTIELNKLEPQAKACRTYIVVDNPTDQAFQALKVELIVFRTDGVIDQRLLLDLAPIRPARKSVKLFDIDTLSCDRIGSILVNDATECRDAAGTVADCMDRFKLTSRTSVALTK